MITAPILNSPRAACYPMLRGLRICFLAGTLGQGGAERQLFHIIKCLVECGAEVNLLLLTAGEFWEEPIRELGVPIHFVGAPGSRLGRLFRVMKIVRQLGPQVIQSQHAYTNSYASLAARAAGCRDIGAVRNDGVTELSANGPFFGRLHLRLPRLIAANSRTAIRNLTSMRVPAGRFFFLPNVVDTEHFQVLVRPLSGEMVILGIGRLVHEKRFDIFLRLIACLRSAGRQNVRAVILGGGPLKARLESLAANLSLGADAVAFVGPVSDVRDYLRHASVLLLSSDHEGTPNVIMEAMACGLPVVATKVGGVPDLVKHGETGFLFEPDDTGNAVAALERLAGEPNLAAEMGLRARSFIEKNHSADRLPQFLTGLYEKVLASTAAICN